MYVEIPADKDFRNAAGDQLVPFGQPEEADSSPFETLLGVALPLVLLFGIVYMLHKDPITGASTRFQQISRSKRKQCAQLWIDVGKAMGRGDSKEQSRLFSKIDMLGCKRIGRSWAPDEQ